jgi:hypothetical protein
VAPTLARTLAISRSQLGTVEPDRSQITKYGTWYASWAKRAGYVDTYWCAMYQAWVLATAGFSVAETGRHGNCGPWIESFKGRRAWSLSPVPGALVFFDWDHDRAAEHVGMVESLRPDGRLVTLEGNASRPGARDGVWRMVRSRADVLGYGHIPYGTTPMPGPPATRMPGPVAIPAGSGGALKATADARQLPWASCPQMGRGFGGPEDAAQAQWVTYWHALVARWSPGYFRTLMASTGGRYEVARHEIGPQTITAAFAVMRVLMGADTPPARGVIPPVAWRAYQRG